MEDPRTAAFKASMPELETLDAMVPVTGMLPDDFGLWPAALQDQVNEKIELENLARHFSGKPRVALARVRCVQEPTTLQWWVHLVLQTALYVEGAGDDLHRRMN